MANDDFFDAIEDIIEESNKPRFDKIVSDTFELILVGMVDGEWGYEYFLKKDGTKEYLGLTSVEDGERAHRIMAQHGPEYVQFVETGYGWYQVVSKKEADEEKETREYVKKFSK